MPDAPATTRLASSWVDFGKSEVLDDILSEATKGQLPTPGRVSEKLRKTPQNQYNALILLR
jgi:hypothetical protein